MSKIPSVALLMVTHNRAELLEQVLNQVNTFYWDYSEFLVIDNASTDETTNIISKYEKGLNIQFFSLDSNIGHGAGLAKGLDFLNQNYSNLDYVVFLEDDSIPQADYLSFLLNKIQGTGFTLISSSGSLVSLGKRTKLEPNESEILAADFALFDGAIARFHDLINIGFPVRDWFMMFDDFEYCYRIRKAGFNIGVVANPHLEILHEGWGGGVSHSHLWRSYYQSRNFVHFVRLHFTMFTLWDFVILQGKRLVGGFFTKNGLATTKMRLMGIRAGIVGKKGRSLDLKTLKER